MTRIHFSNSFKALFLFVSICLFKSAAAQQSWPLVIESDHQVIYVYEPEAENYTGNELTFRSAVSISEPKDAAPVFGTMWAKSLLQDNPARNSVSMISVTIEDIRFADGENLSAESQLIQLIQTGVARQRPEISQQQLQAKLNSTRQEAALASGMNNTPPRIIYTSEPSILVTIDGNPQMEPTNVKGVNMVSNTPFLILEYDRKYYLSNGSLWYQTTSIIGRWTPETKPPKQVRKAAESLKNKEEEEFAENIDSEYPNVIVSLEPAELIQTDGTPALNSISGTYLYYITNTDDYLILDSKTRTYYLLLAGRWYSTSRLSGAWAYVPSENLPEEFAQIPEGAAVDAVLANVPGTMAARDAVMDAQIPQTAMVDRATAATTVEYDGQPIFEPIQGTGMRMASNSSVTVIADRNEYYAVDNGVWFVGASAQGPWRVSDHRPVQVDIIPASSPAYNVKYVYIYHSTPQVVYVGYTRGYLSGFVVGRTVVYGTGFHYRPWRGTCFYPRPWTWGFGMSYNPWWGWSVGFRYGAGGRGGWFAYNCNPRRPNMYHQRTGWWGPSAYRPPYRVPYTHYYGSRQAVVRNNMRGVRMVNERSYAPSRSSNVYYSSRESNVRRGGVEPLRRAPSRSSASERRDTYTSYSRMAQPNNRSDSRGSDSRVTDSRVNNSRGSDSRVNNSRVTDSRTDSRATDSRGNATVDRRNSSGGTERTSNNSDNSRGNSTSDRNNGGSSNDTRRQAVNESSSQTQNSRSNSNASSSPSGNTSMQSNLNGNTSTQARTYNNKDAGSNGSSESSSTNSSRSGSSGNTTDAGSSRSSSTNNNRSSGNTTDGGYNNSSSTRSTAASTETSNRGSANNGSNAGGITSSNRESGNSSRGSSSNRGSSSSSSSPSSSRSSSTSSSSSYSSNNASGTSSNNKEARSSSRSSSSSSTQNTPVASSRSTNSENKSSSSGSTSNVRGSEGGSSSRGSSSREGGGRNKR